MTREEKKEKFFKNLKKLSIIRGIKQPDGTFKRMSPLFKEDYSYVTKRYKKDESGNIHNYWTMWYADYRTCSHYWD